jgi:hypothetical protein
VAKKLAVPSTEARGEQSGDSLTGRRDPGADGPDVGGSAEHEPDRFGRRRWALPVQGLAFVVGVVLVFAGARLLADPGADAVDGMLRPQVPVLTLLFRVALLLALATCGGIALLRPLLGFGTADPGPSTSLPSLRLTTAPPPLLPSPVVVTVTWLAAGIGVVVCAVGALTGQASGPQCGLVAVLFVAVALFIQHGRGRGHLIALAVVGVALIALSAIVLASARSGLSEALDVLFSVGASVLLGSSVYSAALLRDHLPGPGALADLARQPARIAPGWLGRRLPIGGGSAEPSSAARVHVMQNPESALVATRLAWSAFGAGVVSSVAGVAQLALSGPRTWSDAVSGSYGALALAGAVLVSAATVTWWWVWRALRRADGAPAGVSARVALWSAAAAVLLAVGAAASLAAVARPPAGPVPGTPLLRPVALGQHRLAVLVSPMRPGLNLVHVSDPKGEDRPKTGMAMGQLKPKLDAPVRVSVGGSGAPGVTATDRPGASGQWALINIPAGARSLTLESPVGGVTATAQVPVDVGSDPGDGDLQRTLAGPDGAECVSAELGALSAGAAPERECPAQQLSAGDAASLTDTVTFLADQKATTFDIASDDSPRSKAAAALIRTEAGRRGIRIADVPGPNDTLLVTTGWAGAVDALDQLTARVTGDATGGAVLAPWLATDPILSTASREMVPLRFNPDRPQARAYLTTVAALFPGSAATPAGYLAWAAQIDPADVGETRFYGATRSDPNAGAAQGGASDDGSPDGWYPGGDIVAINNQ